MRGVRFIYVLAVTLASGASQAANVVNFDDITGSTLDCAGYILPNNAACTRIPGAYNGFTWDNGWVVNGCAFNANTGYCRSTVSRPNTLFNGYAAGMSIKKADHSLFNFFGASIGIAWSPGWVTFAGRRNGNAVYSTTRNMALDPTYVTLRYYNIDELYITSANQMVLDDFSLSAALCQTPGLTYNVTSPAILGSQIYYAYANFNTCFGSLIATSIDRTTGAYASTANWEGGCTLSGPLTPPTTQVPTGPTPPCSAVPPNLQPRSALGLANRSLATFDMAGQVAANLFSDVSVPNSAQSAFVNTVNPVYGPIQQLRYAGGNTNLESLQTGIGFLRARSSQLGDVVDSSPVVVGPANSDYDTLQSDLLYQTSLAQEASGYAAFKVLTANRPNVVYVGANDGFVHAFRAGQQNSNGDTVGSGSVPNDGQELLAYAPSSALATLYSTAPNLSYSDQNYDHNYFVDATPGVGDAYVNGAWQTWLVGGLGAGGNASGPVSSDTDSAAGLLYCINITDPGNFTPDGISHQRNVHQEVNSGHAGVAGSVDKNSILCQNTPAPDGTPGSCASNMGAIYGTPVIRRMHNGKWNIIFGNGLYSQSGKAGVFFLTAIDDLVSGNNFWADARATPVPGQKNGIVQVTPVDLDGDGVVDFIYAADVQGNVWRYDVTSSMENYWTAAPVKVFSTPNAQPITTKLLVSTLALSSGNAVLIEFGTGRAWPLLNAFGNNYASGVQSLYGIMDWQFDAWNRRSANHRVSLSALPAGSSLVAQSITGTSVINGVNYRTASANPVCWIGASGIDGCTSYTHYGWKLDLPGVGNAGFREQVVFDPQLVNGVLVVNTLSPGWPLDTSVGYTMTVTTVGGAPPTAFFRGANGAPSIIGANLNGLGTAVFVPTTSASLEMYQKNSTQQATVTDIAGTGVHTVKRQTWSRLR